MEHLDRHRAAFPIAGEMNHPHAAFPKAVLKAIRAEGPRQVFGRWHRGFQSTKHIACCGAIEMLPIGNGLAARGTDPGRAGPPGQPRPALGRANAVGSGPTRSGRGLAEHTTITNIATCGVDR
jgi:hypothetical protein